MVSLVPEEVTADKQHQCREHAFKTVERIEDLCGVFFCSVIEQAVVSVSFRRRSPVELGLEPRSTSRLGRKCTCDSESTQMFKCCMILETKKKKKTNKSPLLQNGFSMTYPDAQISTMMFPFHWAESICGSVPRDTQFQKNHGMLFENSGFMPKSEGKKKL